jgi:hypothetical protein
MTVIGLFSDWCQQLIGLQVSLATSYINDAELFIAKRASANYSKGTTETTKFNRERGVFIFV